MRSRPASAARLCAIWAPSERARRRRRGGDRSPSPSGQLLARWPSAISGTLDYCVGQWFLRLQRRPTGLFDGRARVYTMDRSSQCTDSTERLPASRFIWQKQRNNNTPAQLEPVREQTKFNPFILVFAPEGARTKSATDSPLRPAASSRSFSINRPSSKLSTQRPRRR